MKKSKKFLSMLLAISMILAMSVSAFAAQPAAKISEFAGKTMTVGLYRAAEDGTTHEEILYVDIPDGATVDVQRQLIHQAINGEADVMPLTTDYDPMGTVELGSGSARLTQADLSVPSGAELLSSTQLAKDYSTIYVEFYKISVATGSPTKINARVQNNDKAGSYNVFDTGDIDFQNRDAVVLMRSNHYYGGGTCYLDSGDSISVWASTNTGSLTCNWVVSVK